MATDCPSFEYMAYPALSSAVITVHHSSMKSSMSHKGERSHLCKDGVENGNLARKLERAQIAYECVYEAREDCRLGALHERSNLGNSMAPCWGSCPVMVHQMENWRRTKGTCDALDLQGIIPSDMSGKRGWGLKAAYMHARETHRGTRRWSRDRCGAQTAERQKAEDSSSS